ncbi:MAG: UbiD family decarboxylase, partial [Rhodospirillaceae bacterium]|nr:UbiD family decarboxylase [Rhodospirillaceae bacterium]
MADKNLREFMKRLEEAGDLVRVTEPVSPYLEMTEIQTRLLADGGPAVLFENVVDRQGRKYDYPMLVNLFGTVKRAAWGMGREPDTLRELGETLAFMRQPEPPGGF